MDNNKSLSIKTTKLNNIEIITNILNGLIVIITTPICIITIRELIKMSKIHKNFRLTTISISVTFLVVERIVALIFVETYEHFNSNIPILGIIFSIISWIISIFFQVLYEYKLAKDFHTICLTGFVQIIIIACYVVFFFYKIYKLKKSSDHSLTKRYQEEENLKSASLLKYILTFTIIATIYNIGFYIIFITYDFYVYGNGFSLLTFQIPQLIQVMTNTIVMLKQQGVFNRCLKKFFVVLFKFDKVSSKNISNISTHSRIKPIDLNGTHDRTNAYFELLQNTWNINKPK
uniref:G-protein coupled receptors family 1 profile domain-containing protein n=1 Tax=Strongyloides stercoralis TaxID=6248 RepID=A0AAF5DM88_STRER